MSGLPDYWYNPYDPLDQGDSSAESDAVFVDYMDQPFVVAGDSDRTDLEETDKGRLPKENDVMKMIKSILSSTKNALIFAFIFLTLLLLLKRTSYA